MIRVFVNGAAGRMGSVTVRAVEASEHLQLVGTGGRADDLAAAIADCGAEVVVDFTIPAVALENALTILASGACPVIGTTGLSEDDLQQIRTRCDQVGRGGLYVPNFSIGAVLMMRVSREAARHLPDVEIIEAHHPGKLDSPSGTARSTAQQIAAARSSESRAEGSDQPARGLAVEGVPVHSVRLPGLIAEQQVLFGAPGQTLSIRHTTYDREAFMPGVVLACRRVVGVRGFGVGLEGLLFDAESSP